MTSDPNRPLVISHTQPPPPDGSLRHDPNFYPDSSLDSRVPEEQPIESPRRKKCNCKNSRCLKLYCECFAQRGYCDDCNCIGCANTPANSEEVRKAVTATLERNPKAFKSKIKFVAGCNDKGVHDKGCHCKKSHCLKRYCECYQAGVQCGDKCRCVDCKNHAHPSTSPKLRRQSLSPPHKRMRPSSVPSDSIIHFKSSPPSSPSGAMRSSGSFSPMNELVSAASEEFSRSHSADQRPMVFTGDQHSISGRASVPVRPMYQTNMFTPPSFYSPGMPAPPSNNHKDGANPFANRTHQSAFGQMHPLPPLHPPQEAMFRPSPDELEGAPIEFSMSKNLQRCASAPLMRQDPAVLNEILGLMKNTVTLDANSQLALAPLTPSPRERKYIRRPVPTYREQRYNGRPVSPRGKSPLPRAHVFRNHSST